VAPCLSEPSLWGSATRDDVFADLRKHDAVTWQEEPETIWSDRGRGYWAVVRHADVRHVSRSTDQFVSGLGTELFDLPVEVARSYSGMLNMDAPEHTRFRAYVKSAFSSRRIGELEERIRSSVGAILDSICENGSCDFAKDAADALPTAVTCDLLGVPQADRHAISGLSRSAVPLGDPEFGGLNDSFSAARELIAYGKQLRQERLRVPSDDLLTVLATEEIDGERLDADEVGTFFELLITAGIETTGAAIAHGLIALSEHPDQMGLWKSDFATHAASAVEEVLRWSTPVIHFRRTAVVDTRIAGIDVAVGDKVLVFFNSANRDEAVFNDPSSFDIGRAYNPHLTFGGGGPHFCLGAHLARLELRILFEELFQRLPDIAVSGAPVYMHSMFFNGVKALPCQFTPRPRRPS
jgi:cytochrome P450